MPKTRSAEKAWKLDVMSVVVLLVMAVFGGLVGFYLGKASVTSDSVSAREAAMMMKEKGTMMQETGRMMGERGKRWNDKEVMDKGTMLQQEGFVMTQKGEGMMMAPSGY